MVMEVCNVISGLLSKSRGQLLRIATVLHMLFSIDNSEQPLADEVSEAAVKAAVNFIRTANQQTAYIAGRETLQEEFDKFKTGTSTCMQHPILYTYFLIEVGDNSTTIIPPKFKENVR